MEIKLDGLWQFAYTRPILKNQDASLSREQTAGWEFVSAKPELTEIPRDFSRTIRVPGYWDDQKEAFAGLDTATNPEYAPIPYPMPDNLDASYPYIVGTVWYRRSFTLENEAPYGELTLLGVSTEARVWVNGRYVSSAFGYTTPHRFSMDGYLKQGENTLLIAVDNDPRDRLGTSTRGWKSFTGGLNHGVTLRITGRCRIRDAAAFARDARFVTLDALFDGDIDGAELGYAITDGDKVVKSGRYPVDGLTLTRDFSAMGLVPWSDLEPKMYTLRLTLSNGEGVMDELTLPFGFRAFKRAGERLTLNGRPLYMRGVTEHGYYPKTCTPPTDMETYLHDVTVMKEFGFNFLRFHTSVPNEEYMTACDRLGMLIQAEPPVKFTLEELENILRTCRRHPSVVILCAGNEELLNEDKLTYLSRASQMVHTIAPAMLFSPHEALRGIEYYWNITDIGTDCVHEPFFHNARRLAAVQRFSDVYGQSGASMLSYVSSKGDCHYLDHIYSVYHRPLLGHEAGIFGSYIDIRLEKRYEGTRIGTEMYAKAREYMTREGIIDTWERDWLHSCYLQSSVRKAALEPARKTRKLSGFDYLGFIDCHWHHTGYQCGVMNEFFEEKPGSSRNEVLKFNGPVVLLWDNRNHYTFRCGADFACPFMISQYDSADWGKGTLSWTITDAAGERTLEGSWETPAIPVGRIQELGDWHVTMPNAPGRYTLTVALTDGKHSVDNSWSLWCFADTEKRDFAGVRVTDTLTEEDVAALEQGGRVFLTDTAPFPAQKLEFQPMPAGRPIGMVSTTIARHPAFAAFPHEDWCDWQFRTLLEDGTAVRWGTINAPENPAPYKPLLHVCLGYKQAGRFAAVCEFTVGKGRLLVCGLKLKGEEPEQLAMRNALGDYLASEDLTADNEYAPALSAAALGHFLHGERDLAVAEFDMGYDKAGQKNF